MADLRAFRTLGSNDWSTDSERGGETVKDGNPVERFLAGLLASGDYGPGAKLPTERAIAQRLGAGRSAIRNELARLEAQGRIVRLLGSGTYVSQDTPPAMAESLPALRGDASPQEIMEARVLIEPPLAGLVVANGKTADFERLEASMHRAEQATSLEEFEKGDGEFHQIIAEATHSRLVVAIYAMITEARDATDWGELKRRNSSAERRAAYERDHRDIYAALKARHQAGAEAALRAHLQRVRTNLFSP